MSFSIFQVAAFQEVSAPKSLMALHISAVTERWVKCKVFQTAIDALRILSIEYSIKSKATAAMSVNRIPQWPPSLAATVLIYVHHCIKG